MYIRNIIICERQVFLSGSFQKINLYILLLAITDLLVRGYC